MGIETSNNKKLKKKKSFGLLSTTSSVGANDTSENEGPKKLKKKSRGAGCGSVLPVPRLQISTICRLCLLINYLQDHSQIPKRQLTNTRNMILRTVQILNVNWNRNLNLNLSWSWILSLITSNKESTKMLQW